MSDAELAAAARDGVITSETVVVELGAGLGLPGLVCAALGAKAVVLTDAWCEPLRTNVAAAALPNARMEELWWCRSDERPVAADDDVVPDRSEGASAADPTAVETLLRSLPCRPHLILGADICATQPKRDMEALADTMASLAAPYSEVLVGYEDRENWTTLEFFWEAAEFARLDGDSEELTTIEGHNACGSDADLMLLNLRLQ